MPYLHELIRDPATVKAMHPSELAGYVLEAMRMHPEVNGGMKHRRELTVSMAEAYRPAPHGSIDKSIMVALACAISWLETNLLIVKAPDQDSDWYVVTPLGHEVGTAAGVQRLVELEQLPPAFLHPALLSDALPQFQRRRYDLAVFAAFRELEIALRDAAGFGADMIGVKLANEAFHPDRGPLTDLSSEPGERQALMAMAAGAIGSYKNPHSHRRVELGTADAREAIVLASHLLKIVDSRRDLAAQRRHADGR